MAINKFQFMNESQVRLLVGELVKKTNVRINERIVTEINENSTDKQVLSAKALNTLLTVLNQADETIGGGLDSADEQLTSNGDVISGLLERDTEQNEKLAAIETETSNLSDLVEAFTHLNFQTVIGNIDTVTEPANDIIYLQKDNEADTTWMMYIMTESNGWVNVGDTEVDLTGYWSKDETAQMREALGIHDAESVSDDDIVDLVEAAFEETSVNIGGEPFTITADNRHLVGYTDTTTDLVIPSVVTDENGVKYQVTSIGNDAFKNCTNLTSVTIPEGVTSIYNYPGGTGSGAFYNCTSLTSVTIPSTVTKIGTGAFNYCTSLESINIPEGVTEIGDYVFYNCTNLTSVTIPSTVTKIGYGVFSYCTKLTNMTIPSTVTDIGGSIFSYTGLTNVVIPEGSTSIPSYMFNGCTKITSAIIPSTVTKIGYGAFEGCTNLTEVIIPEGVTTIEENAFEGCTNLTEVIIPEGVTTIEDETFSGCTKLTSVTIPSTVTKIGADKFASGVFKNCTSLTNVEIPESVTSIGNYVFSGCTKLTSVEIPESVTSIGEYAFQRCTGLTSVTIPSTVTKIGTGAFTGCTNVIITYMGTGEEWDNNIGYDYDKNLLESNVKCLDRSLRIKIDSSNLSLIGYTYETTDLVIPSVVTDENGNQYTVIGIEYGAFTYCSNLNSVTIPSTVTSIGDSAFNYCDNLNSVIIHEGVTSIGEYAFQNCTSLTSVTIPSTVTSIGAGAFQGCNNVFITYMGTGEEWDNNIGYDSNKNLLESNVKCLDRSPGIKINNSNLSLVGYTYETTDLVIPSVVTDENGNQYTVTSIGDDAFRGCANLTSVTIPSTVTSIGEYAFQNCTSLTSVTIPSTVTSIGDGAFYECTSLKSVVIPEGVTSIGSRAFTYCSNLNSVTIPEGLTSIGEAAFNGCYNLTNVYYTGTEEQWSAINIDAGNDSLTYATKTYNYQG